jgi:hypothetical protein
MLKTVYALKCFFFTVFYVAKLLIRAEWLWFCEGGENLFVWAMLEPELYWNDAGVFCSFDKLGSFNHQHVKI